MKIDIIRSFFRYYLKNKTMSRDGIDINKISNILIMSNTAIGDSLFSTPVIKLIKEHYPDKNIIALLNPDSYKLFETNPYIDVIVTYRGKWRNFFQTALKLRKNKIDLVFIFYSNEPQATPLAFLSGSRYIIKIPNQGNKFNLLHYNKPISRSTDSHTILARLKQLEYIGIDDKSFQMELFPNSSWYEPIRQILDKKHRYIGIQIGASTVSRMWFNDRWASLVKKILKYDEDIKIVLTGSPQERHLTDALEQSINNRRVLNLAGKFDICSAAALIGSFDLLITPDTGPLHIAAAMGKPTIAISVAGSASNSNPIDFIIPHIFIQKPKTCRPCIDKKCKDQKCMLQISVDEVFDSIVDLKIMSPLRRVHNHW